MTGHSIREAEAAPIDRMHMSADPGEHRLCCLSRRPIPAGASAAIAIGALIHGAGRDHVHASGMAVGSVLQDMQGFQLIMNFIVLPLFFFSSLFPAPELPAAMRLAVRSTD